jgi:hypothetical protein
MFELQSVEKPRGCATPVAVMTIVAFFGIFGLPYYLTAVLFGAPVVLLSGTRVTWRIWEAYILVVPTITYWVGLLLAPSKGLFQPPLELLFLGFGVPLALGVRVARGRKQDAWPLTAWLIGALAYVAFVVAVRTPPFMAPD